ncbi:hypothetical protein TNCT_667881 [Trichonephila clavata]|uniref:Uncharacterized protein n=1 Tax=Trichonephila clavata TaxID=2740835 RepID=A0A8X6LX78_TRICU|nr:hypothetical protein TNCT_667881 [Trichonephila clavata]
MNFNEVSQRHNEICSPGWHREISYKGNLACNADEYAAYALEGQLSTDLGCQIEQIDYFKKAYKSDMKTGSTKDAVIAFEDRLGTATILADPFVRLPEIFDVSDRRITQN